MRVLPAHADANLADASQLSLPSALAAAGRPAPPGARVGRRGLLVAIAGGIVIASASRRSSARPEALVWLATMIGTIAAPHLHTQQLTYALPGALSLCTLGTAPWLARAAVYGLAIPWVSLMTLEMGSRVRARRGARRVAQALAAAAAGDCRAWRIVLRPAGRAGADLGAPRSPAASVAILPPPAGALAERHLGDRDRRRLGGVPDRDPAGAGGDLGRRARLARPRDSGRSAPSPPQ